MGRPELNKKDVELVDQLFLGETAYDLIIGYIDEVVFPNKPSDQYEEFKQSLVRFTYKTSLNIVFQFAESPIEKIFLNALLWQNLNSGPYLLKYTEPLYPVNEVIGRLRLNYEIVMQMWKNFQMATGEEDIEKFMAYVFDTNTLTNQDREIIIHHLLYEYCLKHSNAFHLSLQCVFEDIKVGGKYIRPDIFIWVPSRPECMLIVECDGFKYHSDNYAFTNDRERDRVLKDRGFQVLRFSGQEIVSQPVNKAKELNDYLVKLQAEMFLEEIL